MKHIVFVAHLSEVSGAGVALIDIAAAMAVRDLQVTLVLPGPGDLADRARSRNIDPVIVDNPEVGLSDLGFSGKMRVAGRRILYILRLARLLRQHKASLCYVNTSASIFPAIAARLAGVPVVWHIHETYSSNSKTARFKKSLIRKCSRAILYASVSGKNALRHPEDKPFLVVRNPVDLQQLMRVRRDRQESLPDQHPEILMNGAYHLKGPDILLRAARMLPQSPIINIVGAKSEAADFTTTLQNLADSPELQGRVFFHGLQKSMIPWLQQTSLFVSPSRTEGTPIAIVEAMAAGVPVISTDVGDCADLLDHGACGWIVPPESPEALSSAIAQALQSPHIALEKSNAGFNKVIKIYGDASFWDSLTNLLKTVVR